ncbi:MAG: cation transporter, partial [Bacteroidia bacterium]|nr:cation transporter [Bacteroidia bacterium]
DVDPNKIEEELLSIQQVAGIHHTNIWSLEGQQHVFSTHVQLCKLDSIEELRSVKDEIKNVLKPYGFKHCTVETELEGEPCNLMDED